MTDSPPTAPPELSPAVAEALAEASPERLRAVADYAEALAAHREQADRAGDAGGEPDSDPGDDGDSAVEDPGDPPDEVPAKASLTVKEINDNRYYYWQWREGDQIKSKYKGPVDSGE